MIKDWKLWIWSAMLLVVVFVSVHNSTYDHMSFWNGIALFWTLSNINKILNGKLS